MVWMVSLLLLMPLPSPSPPSLAPVPEHFSNAAVTAVSGPSGMGEAWGYPMATSTPAPSYYGNSGVGFKEWDDPNTTDGE